MRPDHTILWIAEEDLALLPENVLSLKNSGLEIRSTANLKSYGKILPALDVFPNAFICTADDDLYYRSTWLEELLAEVETGVIVCHRAHELRFDSAGQLRHYAEWDFDVREARKSERLFPTSGAGALYPPGSLSHSAADRRAAFEICPSADDIWLYWMGRKNGFVHARTGPWHPLIVWPGSQSRSLSDLNLTGGGNDSQIGKMADYYGVPATPSSL